MTENVIMKELEVFISSIGLYMFQSLPLFALILIFIGGAIAVWIAGIQLSNTTDVLSSRLGLGQALGLAHNLGIAIGNILGGIGIQTVVLVILDVFGLRGKAALSYRSASLQLVLEGVLVVAVLVIAIMGTQLPSSLIFARLAPGDVLI